MEICGCQDMRGVYQNKQGCGKHGSGVMSGTAVDFSNFSKIRLWGGRGDPTD